MDALLSALETAWPASTLRASRWGYAALNASHIAGIALLVGAIVPMDLRLIGVWPTVARRDLARVLVPVAATGLGVALVTGVLLFCVRASEYAALSIFWIKLSLVTIGGLAAMATHVRFGLWFDARGNTNLPVAGVVSMACWLSALASGRLIGFFQ